jgi:hypothetical protein
LSVISYGEGDKGLASVAIWLADLDCPATLEVDDALGQFSQPSEACLT